MDGWTRTLKNGLGLQIDRSKELGLGRGLTAVGYVRQGWTRTLKNKMGLKR
jgi:hypothetical protein